MSKGHQLFRQPMHHPLGAAIQLGWNSLRQRSYLRDAHLTFSSAIMNVETPSVRGTGNANQGNVPALAKFPSINVTYWTHIGVSR
jgi:hypothetical protein